jgi:hypothetical protein
LDTRIGQSALARLYAKRKELVSWIFGRLAVRPITRTALLVTRVPLACRRALGANAVRNIISATFG